MRVTAAKFPGRRHLVIPDPQISSIVPTNHIDWAAQAVVEYKPDVVIVLGDWWDMSALSSYEKPGSKQTEGQRIKLDIEAGNEAFRRFVAPMTAERARLIRNKERQWNPELHFLMGNHEARIDRLVKEQPKFEKILCTDMLETPHFERHPFLEIVEIDGVWYSHYFSQTHSGKAIGGSIDNRLNKIGHSFVQGHQQGLLYGTRQFPGSTRRHGLVAGSFYQHDEHYRDAQSNGEWRGIVVLNEVQNGDLDVMPLSMNYLRRKYG